jgi:hypothetical protein
MKPDWDKLMKEFDGSSDQLVGDVDCTTAGKALCDANGVKGYPTIKWGDPSALEDYSGGRDFKSLQKFAQENLKPVCSPGNVDLCDEQKQKEIKRYLAMDQKELTKLIKAEEEKLETAETEYKESVAKLQENYKQLSTDKDETIAAVKSAGLGLMKAVAAAGSKGSDEL